MSAAPAPRPGSVTVVVILTWIVAVTTILAGIFFLEAFLILYMFMKFF